MAQVDYSKIKVHMSEALAHIDVYNNGCGVRYLDNASMHIDSLISEIMNDDRIRECVSRKAILDQVIESLKRLKMTVDSSDASVNQEIGSILVILKQMIKKWQVYVPVEKLVLDNLETLAVGNITFHPTDKINSILLEKLRRSIDTQPETEHNDTQKGKLQEERYNEINQKYLSESLSGSTVIAEVILEAEKTAVADVADFEVETAVNLLRCYTRVLQSSNLEPRIGICGSLGSGIHRSIIFEDNGSTYFNSRMVAGIGSFVINAEDVDKLRDKCGFDLISGMLSKSFRERTHLEKVLSTAIPWIGQAFTIADDTDRILDYCIALEQMMISGERGDITDRIATRLAFLLSEDRDNRIYISKRAKELYGLRSSVVHTGGANVQESDIDELAHMVVGAFIKLTKHLHEWTTHNDFTDWVRNKQFS